jgi:hypothetical protein
VEFRTRSDGVVYPLASKKKKGVGAGVAAVALGSAVAFGAGGTGGVAVGGAVDSAVGSATNSVIGQTVRARTNNGKNAARNGRRAEAWVRMGLKIAKNATDEQLRCALRSHGQVRKFFLDNPCSSLDRELIAIVDEHGNTFVVSIAWVRMPMTAQAEQLKRLADTYGTGNVSPIASTALGIGTVRFTGKYYDSRPDGNLVVIAESATATGRPDPDLLEGAAQVAAQLPPP